jgi:hypothetical protein
MVLPFSDQAAFSRRLDFCVAIRMVEISGICMTESAKNDVGCFMWVLIILFMVAVTRNLLARYFPAF